MSRALFAAFLLPVVATGAPAEPAARYTQVLERALARGYPAIVAVVDRPGEPFWSGAAGTANLETKEAMTVGHAVHFASVSKQLTAAAALRLVDAGQLALSDRIVDRLDAARLPALAELPNLDRITVAHLLDHSSGLYPTNNDPDYVRAWVGPDAGRAAAWGPAEFVALAAKNSPTGSPGEGHWYSDTNYILLGEIVARATGEPLREHLKRTIFRPLGMSSAYFLSELAPGAPPPATSARGYLKFSEPLSGLFDRTKFREVSPALYDTTSAGERHDGAGGVVATAGDFHRFAVEYFRGGLLSRASRALVLASGDGLDAEKNGTRRQRITSAVRTPAGVVVMAEGDGPGGSNTLIAYHAASGTLVVAALTSFGLFDEHDFLVDELVAAAIAPRGPAPN